MKFDSEYQADFLRSESPVESGEPLRGGLKRGFDLCIALSVLALMLPVMILLAGFIKASMGGPVLYRHRRIGRGGAEFECLKFRTMVVNADQVLEALLASDMEAAESWRRNQKLPRDPRVTLIGHVLRRSSLDELPQLINVLRGEMSCVGPRPIVRSELARYGVQADLLLTVRPGMTGLWQVSGRSNLNYDQRVALDCEYVRKWSLWLDFKLLLRTIPTVLNTKLAS